MQKDLCFNCYKQGHWARNCPSKTPRQSPQSVRGGVTGCLDHPVIQCRCGNGACIVLVSKTEKNPDRKFYSCPVRGVKCNFFSWCDEVKDSDINFAPRMVAPKCTCGAGNCRRETETSGPHAGRSYFVCPIKKGLGACNFFQWENTEVSECEDESKGYTSPQSTCDSHRIFDIVNNLHKSGDLPISTASRSLSKDVVLIENLESGYTSDILSANQHDRSPFLVPENDSSVLDSANGKLVVQVEKPGVVHLMSQSVIHCRQMEFWRQISAAVDCSKKDIIDQSLGLHVFGWLGRLAFPPSRCLTECPPAPYFCVIFPSFDPICVSQDRDMLYSRGSTALSRHLPNNELDRLSPSIPSQKLQLWNGDLRKPSGVKRSSATVDETGTNTMLKFLEQTEFRMNQLFTILSSIDRSDRNSVTRGASEVFSVLNDLSIENNAYNGYLKEFVDCTLIFNAIEQSICNERSMEELIELYDEHKVQLDDISNAHKKAVTDFTASSRRLQSLNEEASRVRNMLARIENQLSCCEAETSDLKTCVDVISRDMLESKRSMQEAEEALVLGKQREEELRAAKAALEKARIQLQEAEEALVLGKQRDEELHAAKAALEKIFGSRQEVCGLHPRKRRRLELLQLEECSTSQQAAIENNNQRQHGK